MNTIVTDLNDLTKIQVGNLRLEFKELKVDEVLSDVIRSMKRQIEEKGIDIEVNVPEHLPNLWADPLRLSQIFTNLVSNALKYSPEGGRIIIGVEPYSQTENGKSERRYLYIWIRDNGIGISSEDKDNIFQQYFRSESAKEMATGTGLGLFITKNLVELQGGEVGFESELNEGTTFHFTVPIAGSEFTGN